MVKLTADMKEVFMNTKPYYVATASKAGVPNVAPMGMVILQDDDETIWLIDNFMKKTLANLEENPRLSVACWNKDCKAMVQLKCSAVIENSGEDYEKAVAFAHSKGEQFPAKHLIKLKIEEVYSVAPGPEAGSKLL